MVRPHVFAGDQPLCGVYAIVNTRTGRRYIGSSVHIAKRWRDHVWELSQGKHLNPLLQNSWKKHGREGFVCVVVEAVAEGDLLAAEQRHIEANPGGYNLCAKAGKPPSGGRRGSTLSEQTRQLLRERNLGKKLSDETRRRMSEARRQPHKPRSRARASRWGESSLTKGQKISLAKTGKKMSPEAVETNRRAHLGLRPTAEHRAKISASLRATLARKRQAKDAR